MCYYDEWDARLLEAARNARKSKEQAERLMSRAKDAAVSQPDTPAEPEKQPATELDEVAA